MEPREEGEQPEQGNGHKGDGDQPQLPDDLPVEEAGADEIRRVPVEPLDSFEQRAAGLTRLELGQQVTDHVVAERGVDR